MAWMQLTALSLANFRNIPSLEMRPSPGLSVFTGENAQGKSNLLEAIYLLAISKSYRAPVERDLILWEAARKGEYAMVSGTVDRQEGAVELRVGLVCDPGPPEGAVRKQVRINGVASRTSDLVGLLNAVLFSADDIDLVFGSPSVRRRYLDVMLAQESRLYVRTLQRYQRVLAQRNSLLRSLREGRAREQELSFWDESLCDEGVGILEARHHALARVTTLAQELFGRLMGPGQRLDMTYAGTVPGGGEITTEGFKQAMAQALERHHAQERAMAQTVVGPHRDDLHLAVEGVEMGRHASRGQARLAALALRLAEGAFLAERRGEPPVLLLDDVLSELDERRRSLVLEEVGRYPQVWITTADQDLLPAAAMASAHHYRVEAGRVVPESDRAATG